MSDRPIPFSLPFLRREQLNINTYSFFFDRTAFSFQFKPGQYLRMILDIEHPDDRPNSRFFSIASSPANEKEIMVTTHIIQSAFKKKLLELVPGQVVRFMAPFGQFVLDEADMRPRAFLAGGIGVTPFHSMVEYAALKNLQIPITLFASFKTVEEVVFFEEFKKFESMNSNIQIVYTITRPEESKQTWDGETGRIGAEMLKKYIANSQETVYYIAGPEKMVDALTEGVEGMGLPEDQVITESFTGY